MTVGELLVHLQKFDALCPVVVYNPEDSGYENVDGCRALEIKKDDDGRWRGPETTDDEMLNTLEKRAIVQVVVIQ